MRIALVKRGPVVVLVGWEEESRDARGRGDGADFVVGARAILRDAPLEVGWEVTAE
jgi:hypothetical protein